MHSYLARLLVVSTLCLGLGVASAHAQFGFPGLPSPRGFPLPVPGVRVGPGALPLPVPGLYGRNGFGRTLGIIGAVAVGAVILNRMSVYDRREVARRARVVVERNHDERVVDTYRSKDGRQVVTVTAEPARNASDFVDDAALYKPDAPKEPEKGVAGADPKGGAAPPKVAAAPPKVKAEDKPAKGEIVRLSELPVDSRCRRVTTEYESAAVNAAPSKNAAPQPTTTEAKEINVSIMCRTGAGDWKPAGA